MTIKLQNFQDYSISMRAGWKEHGSPRCASWTTGGTAQGGILFSMCLPMRLSMCLSTCLSMSCACLPVYLHLSLSLSLSLSSLIKPASSLPTYQCINFFACISQSTRSAVITYLSSHPSVYLSICFMLLCYLYVHLCVYLETPLF